MVCVPKNAPPLKHNRWVAPFARKVSPMLFEITVSQKNSIFRSFEVCQVEAPSGEIASEFVLSRTKKKYTKEKILFVSGVRLIGDNFIGKAAQHRVQRTAKRSGKK